MGIQQGAKGLTRAMEPDLDGVLRRPEQGRRLGRVELFDVPQEQNGPVGLRKLVDAATHERGALLALHGLVGRLDPQVRRLDRVPVLAELRKQRLDGLFRLPAPASGFLEPASESKPECHGIRGRRVHFAREPQRISDLPGQASKDRQPIHVDAHLAIVELAD